MKFLGNILLILLVAACASSKKSGEEVRQEQAEIYYNHGTQKLVSKDYTNALKNLLHAYELRKDDSRIQNNLGMAYYFKKRPKIAVKFIKMAIKTDPKNTDALMNLATVYMETGQYTLAKAHYEKVLNDLTYEKQFQTYYNLGVLALKKDRSSQAINYFKQAINENENYCPANFQLGQLYFKQRQFKKSLGYFKRAQVGTCYDNPQPLYHQALTLIELEEYYFAKLKLQEVVDRFSLTPYQKLASKKLQTLNKKLEVLESNPPLPSNKNGNILTPDF